MNLRITLYGALSEADPRGFVELDVPADCTIGGVRERLAAHLREQAAHIDEDLLRRSAFATTETILHDPQAVPRDVELAVLPPVGGG